MMTLLEDGGNDPATTPPAPAYDFDGMREQVSSYMDTLEKYTNDILQGRAPWEKLEKEEWMAGAKDYLKARHGPDATLVYNALKNSGDVTTFMSFGLKQKYGDEAVDALMDRYAEETRRDYGKLSERVRKAGMENFAGKFSTIGEGLSKVYDGQPSAYLFAEGLLKMNDQSTALAKSIEGAAEKFTAELDKLTNLIEKLGERYGPMQ